MQFTVMMFKKILRALSATLMVISAFGLISMQAYAEQDPTKPPEAVIRLMPGNEALPVIAWELQGLQDNGKKSFVIVDGKTIYLGEAYQGYQLAKVSHQTALFVTKSGEKKLLKLNVWSYLPKKA